MVTIEKLKEVHSKYSKNEYWNEFYRRAPSAKCKLYIVLDWYYGDTGDETGLEKRQEVYNDLSTTDLEHILAYSQHTPKYAKIRKRIRELKEQEIAK